jgi:hypothetical protein
MLAPPRLPLLHSSEFAKLLISLCNPFLSAFAEVLQLRLSSIHGGQWVVGSNSHLLPLLSPWIIIAPTVPVLQAPVHCHCVLGNIFRPTCSARVPWPLQAIPARRIREAHGVLILHRSFLRLLLLLCLGVLLAFHRVPDVDGEQIDVARIIR